MLMVKHALVSVGTCIGNFLYTERFISEGDEDCFNKGEKHFITSHEDPSAPSFQTLMSAKQERILASVKLDLLAVILFAPTLMAAMNAVVMHQGSCWTLIEPHASVSNKDLLHLAVSTVVCNQAVTVTCWNPFQMPMSVQQPEISVAVQLVSLDAHTLALILPEHTRVHVVLALPSMLMVLLALVILTLENYNYNELPNYNVYVETGPSRCMVKGL